MKQWRGLMRRLEQVDNTLFPGLLLRIGAREAIRYVVGQKPRNQWSKWHRNIVVLLGLPFGSPAVVSALCSDNIVQYDEACDDGNLTSTDGCSSICEIEGGYLCEGSPSSCIYAGYPFACDGTAYIGLGDPTTLNAIDTSVDPFQFQEIGSYAGETYNAFGFSYLDGYLYGWSQDSDTSIVRIGNDATVTYLGYVTLRSDGSLLDIAFYSGDVTQDGKYYVLNNGTNSLYVVDLKDQPLVADVIKLSWSPRCSDLAINPRDGLIYCGEDGSKTIRKIDPVTGSVTPITLTGSDAVDTSSNFGGQWFDPSGLIYLYQNSNGFLYRGDLNAKTLKRLGSGPGSSSNDGGACTAGAVLFKSADTYEPFVGSAMTFTFQFSHSGIDLDRDGEPDGLSNLTFTDTPEFAGVWDLSGLEWSQDGNTWSSALPSGVSAKSAGNNTSTFTLTNLTVPGEQDPYRGYSLYFRAQYIISLEQTPEDAINQATIVNLPAEYGYTLLSDNPLTLRKNDPTPITILPLPDGDNDGLLYDDELSVTLTDPNNPDTDGDGIQDGTEWGVAVEDLTEYTDTLLYIPDADPDSVTDPLDPDTDDDGLIDGEEDEDSDGLVDDPETDPNLVDTDEDGLTDFDERMLIGTVAVDADSDNDGIIDGDEYVGTGILEDWGATDPLNPDSDYDGLQDGTECGVTADLVHKDTDLSIYHPDGNSTSVTNPLDADFDDDGIIDGYEDSNANGMKDGNETDPIEVDTDRDGIQDGTESGITQGYGDFTDGSVFNADRDPSTNTNPLENDTDKDTLWDGKEDKNANGKTDDDESDPNVVDTDGDGVDDGTESDLGLNPRNTDTDGDGFSDGIEVGLDIDGNSPHGLQGAGACSHTGSAALSWSYWILALPLFLLRRAGRKSSGFKPQLVMGILAGGIAAGPAQAQEDLGTESTNATSTTSVFMLNVQRFDANPQLGAWSMTHDAQISKKGTWNLLLSSNYAHNPLELSTLEKDDGRSIGVIDNLFGFNLGLAYSVSHRWQLGVNAPFAQIQLNDADSKFVAGLLGASSNVFGYGDVGVYSGIQIIRQGESKPFSFTVIPRYIFPTGSTTMFLGSGSPRYGGEIAASSRVGRKLFAVNLGYIAQQTSARFANLYADDEFLWRAAASVPDRDQKFEAQVEWIGAASRSSEAKSEVGALPRYGRIHTPMEFLGSAVFRSKESGRWYRVGAGLGLTHGFGTPDFRVFAQAGITGEIISWAVARRSNAGHTTDNPCSKVDESKISELTEGCSEPNWIYLLFVDADGAPVSGASWTINDGATSRDHYLYLPDGYYRLRVTASGYRPAIRYLKVPHEVHHLMRVEMSPEHGSLRVLVMDADRRPIDGAHWSLKGPTELEGILSGETKNIQQGQYTVQVQAPGYAASTSEVRVDYSGVVLAVTLEPGESALRGEAKK